MAKMHGWLVGALDGAGYQQRDLAKAWQVDDAVVSRFISSGKPDLTPERQMMLSQMLGLTNDELLGRLYGGVSMPGVIQLRRPEPVPGPLPTPPSPPPHQIMRDDDVTATIRSCVDRLQQLLGPDAHVSIHIDFNKRSDR